MLSSPGASQCVETVWVTTVGRRLLLITQAEKTRDAAYTHMRLFCSSGPIQNGTRVLNKEARPNRPEQKTLLGKPSSQHFECIPGSFLLRMKPRNIQVWSKLRAACDLGLSQSAFFKLPGLIEAKQISWQQRQFSRVGASFPCTSRGWQHLPGAQAWSCIHLCLFRKAI